MRTFKYEFQHQSNVIRIGNLLDDMWQVHAYFHKWQRHRYKDDWFPYANYNAMCDHLKVLKRTTHPHWNALPSQAIQKELQRILKQSLTELRKLNKSLSRKVKGSGNWWRAVRQLARFYRRISNQRKDWHWKLAIDLCRRFDMIVTETLNLDGMKRLWGRKVSDLSFGQFVEILRFKCSKHNRALRQVGQWTATTKPCSDCGNHNENLFLKDRQWTCPECGSHHDRDINAAINILRAGLAVPVEQM